MLAMSTYTHAVNILLAVAALSGTAACHHKDKDAKTAAPCRRDTEDDIKNAGATGIEGVKTGARTTAEAGRMVGRTTAGLVTGGTNEAGKRWDEGKEDVSDTAHAGGAKTSDQASVPRCTP